MKPRPAFALCLALVVVLQMAHAQSGASDGKPEGGGEAKVEMQVGSAPHEKDEWSVGDIVDLECATKNATGGLTWGPGPVCKETAQELFVLFADSARAQGLIVCGVALYFMYCGFTLSSQEEYDALAAKIKLEQTWQCRVPMVPSKKFFVPFTIQMWGVVEEEHLHVDAHVNLVFHADAGMIIGAAAYPVLDRFQYGKQGSLINLHGPVRWFLKHSFSAYAPTGPPEGAGQDLGLITGILVALAAVVLTGLISCATFALVYRYVLKPRLVQKFLKKD
eukprot:tig00020960_g16549.t1